MCPRRPSRKQAHSRRHAPSLLFTPHHDHRPPTSNHARHLQRRREWRCVLLDSPSGPPLFLWILSSFFFFSFIQNFLFFCVSLFLVCWIVCFVFICFCGIYYGFILFYSKRFLLFFCPLPSPSSPCPVTFPLIVLLHFSIPLHLPVLSVIFFILLLLRPISPSSFSSLLQNSHVSISVHKRNNAYTYLLIQ